MRVIKSFSLVVLAGIVAVGLTVSSPRAATVNTNADGFATGIDNLLVGSEFLDVNFETGTFSEIFGSTFTFDTTQATAILEAIGLRLNAVSPIPRIAEEPGFGTHVVGIPIAFGTTGVGTRLFIECNFVGGECLGYDQVRPDVVGQLATWATTTPSITSPTIIPLPAAFPLYGTGLALMGFLGWRRKRRAAELSSY